MNNRNNSFQQLAIIGATASGKTSLAIKVAKHIDAYILSLDSLAIYKDINIVSAKPTIQEQDGITHFGIDYILPSEDFDVTTFITIYKNVRAQCLKENKHLVIVGGTGFYLKMLLQGVSDLPTISKKNEIKIKTYLEDLSTTYAWLYQLDTPYMSNIESNDKYRIEKALEIFLETNITPTEYFQEHPPIPVINSLPIYQITWDRTLLRERIEKRTNIMFNNGLINEVCSLEKNYTRKPNCMKSIGIKETLAFLDGIYDKKLLIQKITINTARLAKRQTTFNNSQFNNVIKGSLKELEGLLL